MKRNINLDVSALNKGFTLLEIMLSIAILSFLMLGVYYLSDNSIDSVERTTKDDQLKIQIAAAMHRINLDFSKIYNPLFHQAAIDTITNDNSTITSDEEKTPPFEINERFPILSKNDRPIPAILNESKSELIFLSFINQRKIQDTKESNFVWIKYQLRKSKYYDDEEKALKQNKDAPYELIRYYDAGDIYAPSFNFDNLKPSILLRNIKSLEFKFWNSTKQKFIDRSKYLPNPNLLRSIKVKSTILDRNNNEINIERVFISIWPYFDPKVDEEANKPENIKNN